MKNELISIIISVYNEEDSLPLFWYELKKQLDAIRKTSFEIIFINDGSQDNSWDILKKIAKKNKKVKVISFSSNFGHEAAMIAGIDHAKGIAVVCMDADLQHPPEEIYRMLKKYRDGYQVINMVRKENKNISLIRQVSSTLFYFLINKLSATYFEPNASDFFLLSDKAAHILRTEFRERNRFIRGFTQLIGFKHITLSYKASKREKGVSKYSYKKLLSLSLHAFIAFSNLPLHISLLLGFIIGILSIIIGIYTIIMRLIGAVIPGYTTIVTLMSFMFSIQFILIGIIGEYIGFLYTESKKRPIYIIDEIINFKK